MTEIDPNEMQELLPGVWGFPIDVVRVTLSPAHRSPTTLTIFFERGCPVAGNFMGREEATAAALRIVALVNAVG